MPEANQIQTSKNKMWIDESNIEIPYSRINPTERLIEKTVGKIFKLWTSEQERLKKLKKQVEDLCEKCYLADMQSKGVDVQDRKGGYTMYCFNRTVKVERAVHGVPTYDDATIEAAKIKFDEYLTNNLQGNEAFIKDMIIEAFESRNNQLDKNRINKLISYKSKSKNPLFIQACELLSTAHRYGSSSVYYRVYAKDKKGKYKNIDIQFSSIETNDETE